jgi:hypothetical protein
MAAKVTLFNAPWHVWRRGCASFVWQHWNAERSAWAYMSHRASGRRRCHAKQSLFGLNWTTVWTSIDCERKYTSENMYWYTGNWTRFSEWSASRFVSFSPGTNFTGRYVGSKTGLDATEENETSCPDGNRTPVIQPVVWPLTVLYLQETSDLPLIP